MHACDTVSDDSTVLCRITDDLPSDTEIVAMLNRDTDLDLDGERSSYRLARTSLAAIDQIEERPRYVLHCKAKITYDDRGSMSECCEKFTEVPPSEPERNVSRVVASSPPEAMYCKYSLLGQEPS